jgi:hypothetical protein
LDRTLLCIPLEWLNTVVKYLVEWLSFLLHIWEVLILFIGCFDCILSLFTQSLDENAGKIFKLETLRLLGKRFKLQPQPFL